MAILEKSYKAGHDIRTVTNTSHTFSSPLDNPGNDFQLFIPPGTTYVSLLLYAARDAEIGAAARLGLAPTGKYNLKANYYALPWIAPDPPSPLPAFRGQDVQRRNRGGTIIIFELPLNPPQPEPGEWLFIKILSYDGSKIPKLTYTVKVDTEKYNAWYNTDPFDGQGQPAGEPGIEGGETDPIWNETGQADTRDVQEKEVEGECKPADSFACMKYGPNYRPVWNDEKRICECVGDDGDVKPV